MNRKRILSIFLGFLVTGVFVYFLLRGVPWQWSDLAAIFRRVHWSWALLAVFVYLLGHFFRGIRCAWIMRPYRKFSFWRGTQVVWIGYAANNILPARLGEFVRAYALAKREDIPQGITLSTLFVERLLDGLAIVGILWGVSFFIPRYSWIVEVRWIAGLIFFSALMVMLLARFWRHFVERFLAKILQFLPELLAEKIEAFSHRLFDGLACLQWDRYALGIVGMSVMIWLTEGLMFFVLLPAFGLIPSFVTAYLTMSITNLGVLIPSTPGHVGTFHFFCSKALLASGAISSLALGLGYAMMIHALQYLSVTILGLISMSLFGLKMSQFWQETTPEPNISNSPDHSDSSNEPKPAKAVVKTIY